MECHVLDKFILRCLDDLQRTTLELIIEGHGRGLPADNCYLLGFLRLVFVDILFCYRIGAGHELDIHRTVCFCLYRLVHTVAGNMETDTGYLPVL